MSTNLFSCKILNFAKNQQKKKFFPKKPFLKPSWKHPLFSLVIRYIQKLSAFLPGSL